MKRRLDQLLASLGYCSRREAREFLRAHAVTAGGGPPLRDAALKLDPGAADVRVDGEPLDHPDGLLILLNKPTGLVCSHDEREGPRVYDLLPPRWRARNPQVTSIGRLDKETSGLLLLTDRTELVHRYTSPRHKVEKVYRATLDRSIAGIAEKLAATFASGTLQLDGEKTPCAAAKFCLIDDRTATLTLTEGKYHQVRRMFAAAAGATVVALHRERFGALTPGDLAPGEYRLIGENEIGGE
ncbi:ribosomal small subunit pseudouridine synthase A [Opitutaceae bacterium TAV5]|nr:ribosomal small subunit pseudouridine synthase A [Opitutaceae bacterium TAV5]